MQGVRNMATLSVRLDDDTKDKFLKFCEEVGISASTAFTMFAKKVVKEQRIPFDVTTKDPFYSEENLAHLRAAIERMEAGKYEIHNLDEIERMCVDVESPKNIDKEVR